MVFGGLIKRKECWILTLRGWIALFISTAGIFVFVVISIHPFLAVNQPVSGEILVVEGWLPEYAFKKAIYEFRNHNYRLLITTGGPIPYGTYISTYTSFAEFGSAILKNIGFDEKRLVAVSSPAVIKNRTYASAVSLKKWLNNSKLPVKSINVLSLGPHARRTWILFKKALGTGISIGIISVDNRAYDSTRWWKYSSGVRTIINETIAYFYARWMFDPKE